MINRVVLVGRLTRDPELKYTTNGIANLRFSIAVNRQFKQDGKQQADFINCVAWRGQAENMAKFLRKGSLIGVEGRIETGSYQAQDGSTRYTTDIITDNVQFLEPKSSRDENVPGAGYYSQPEPGSGNTLAEKQYSNQHQRVADRESKFNTENPFASNFNNPSYVPGGNEPSQNININDDDLPF